MMNDDLPPPQNPPQEDSVAREIGDWFGQSIWMVLFVAIAGGILYFLMRATH
ncbi:MAG TPA: hypothetical protein VGH02_01510 [Rhizomicrobium sp.]|jgi:hypothetical protein